jgi:hypothetical protein
MSRRYSGFNGGNTLKRPATSRWTFGIAFSLWAALSITSAAQEPARGTETLVPGSITLRVTNRLHPNYLEYITTEIGDTNQLGDTDYFFLITEFYPHFAIIDSTRDIVSLSEELKNPAFRITVFEGDSIADETWAFFLMRVPHFTRKSYMAFEVMEFEYLGKHHKLESERASPESG